MARILIVDHGLCNLDSIRRAFEECGAEGVSVEMSDDPASLTRADKVVLPGVGAFADAMKFLREKGWDKALRKAALEDKLPFFGVCLGMQLMGSRGYETAESEGLGLIPGRVVRLGPGKGTSIEESRIPHMGWNEVIQTSGDNPIFADIASGKDFYFAHSFHFMPDDQTNIAARTPYCGGFVSALRRGHIFGVQFHPEKSQRVGMQLLKNFVEY